MEHDYKNNKIPPRFNTVLKCIMFSLIGAVMYLIGEYYYPTKKLIDSDFLKNSSFLQYVLFLNLSATLIRGRYYFCWYLSSGACIMGGLGYEYEENDKNLNGNWNYIINCDMFNLETATSLRDVTRLWNMTTQNWLSHYVYSRTNNSMVAVYVTSAMWHGFYFGYYLFFITAGIGQFVERSILIFIYL